MFKTFDSSNERITHPFSELVREFGHIIIQKGRISAPIPNTNSFESEEFVKQIGKTREFEKQFFEQNRFVLPTAELTKNPIDAFFQRLVKEYLTNEITRPFTAKTTDEFLSTNSPFNHAPTTLLYTDVMEEFGGTKIALPNQRSITIGKNAFYHSKTHKIGTLANQYRKLIAEQADINAIPTEFTPLFGKTHSQRYFGNEAHKKQITLSQISPNSYAIETYCPKSQFPYGSETLSFEPVSLQTTVSIFQNSLCLMQYPKAPEGYEHVFVYRDGEICFNGTERFEDIGLTLTSPFLPLQSHHTVNKLKRVLDEGHLNLLYGKKDAATFANKPANILARRQLKNYEAQV